jgi:hypothetical protein
MKINQYKTDNVQPYVETLNLTDDVVRIISQETSMNPAKVRAQLEAGGTIYGPIFKYVPVEVDDTMPRPRVWPPRRRFV